MVTVLIETSSVRVEIEQAVTVMAEGTPPVSVVMEAPAAHVRLIDSIDRGVPGGGSTGFILGKASNASNDLVWIDPDTFASGGDIDASRIVTGTVALARIPVATSGTSSNTTLVRADDVRLSDARTPTTHTHTWGQITSTPTTLSGYGITDPVALTNGTYANPSWITSLAWAKLTGVPSTFTPSAHTHPWSDLTGVPSTFTPSAHTHPISQITGITVTSPSAAHVLVYDGSQFVNRRLSFADMVETDSLIDGDFLVYDTADGWVVRNLPSLQYNADQITTGTIAIQRLPVATSGTSSTTLLVRADDSRLSDARTPTGHTHVAANISDSTVVGRSVLTSADATAARTAINAQIAGSYAAASHTQAWSTITTTPTTLSGYGITDPVVLTSGTYANPSWITSLAWAKLTGVPSTFTPATHTHVATDITDSTVTGRSILTAADATAARSAIGAQVAGSYAAASHTHTWGQITSTPTTLSGYGITDPVVVTSTNYADPSWITSLSWAKLTGVPSTFTPSAHTHTWSDLTGVPSTFTPSAHTHGASDIISGTLDVARLPVASSFESTASKVIASNDSRLRKTNGTTVVVDFGAGVPESTEAEVDVSSGGFAVFTASTVFSLSPHRSGTLDHPVEETVLEQVQAAVVAFDTLSNTITIRAHAPNGTWGSHAFALIGVNP